MVEKKIVDILPPPKKGAVKIKEEQGPKIKFSLPQIPSPKFSLPAGKIKFIFLIAVLFAGGSWAYFALGSARIEIWPKLDPLDLETKITVDKSAQSPGRVIPGFVFEEIINLSGEFSSSGQGSLEKKAEGEIRIYNNSSVPQTLIVNTRLQAPLDKFEGSLLSQENPWFRLKSRIVIPAKSFQDAQVIADSAGEKYNIKPSKFSIPGLAGSSQYTLVYGESFKQFTGGEKKEFSQVLVQDLERAKNELFLKSQDEGQKVLREKVPQDFLFLTDAVKVDLVQATSLAQAGEQTGKFNYNISAKASILAAKYNELDELAKDLLAEQVILGKEMDEESLQTSYTLFSIDKSLSKMTLSGQASINTFKPIEDLSLKNGLVGRTLQDAKSVLEKQEDYQKIKIHLWPFWLRSVPKNIEKVKVEVRLDS